MIVADTSALAAILLGEPDVRLFATALFSAGRVVMGAPTAFELRLAMSRKKGPDFVTVVDALIARSRIEICTWDARHIPIADRAFRDFGGKPAQLNFGDCLTYAFAKLLDAPLLYKGNNFSQTDIRSAL